MSSPNRAPAGGIRAGDERNDNGRRPRASVTTQFDVARATQTGGADAASRTLDLVDVYVVVVALGEAANHPPHVSDIKVMDEFYERVFDLKPVVTPAGEKTVGWIARLMDPEGNLIEICEEPDDYV